MFDKDEIEKLTKNATEAIEAWREDTKDSEELLDNADYTLTMLRMAMGDEHFENAHWFANAHRQVIKKIDQDKERDALQHSFAKVENGVIKLERKLGYDK